MSLHLAMPPDDVVAILRSQTQRERPLGMFLGGLGQSGLVGDIGPKRFRLRVASATSPFYRLQLFGEISEEPGGSFVRATIRRHRAADLALLGQLLLGAVIVIAAILSAMSDPDFAPAVVFTIAILAVLMIARWPRASDRDRLRQFLLDAFPPTSRKDVGAA